MLSVKCLLILVTQNSIFAFCQLTLTHSMPDPLIECEFETAKGADAVYKFLDTKAFPFTTFPALNEPLYMRIRFPIRLGGHDVKNFDWKQYLNLPNLHFQK